MRPLWLATCALGFAVAGPAMAQMSASSSASSSGGVTSSVGLPAGVANRMAAMGIATTPPNGTISSGEWTSTTQVNIGPNGQIGVATSISGGFSSATTFSGFGGSIAQSGSRVLSQAQGFAINGGSYDVGSSVVSTPSGTSTSSYGGQFTQTINGSRVTR